MSPADALTPTPDLPPPVVGWGWPRAGVALLTLAAALAVTSVTLRLASPDPPPPDVRPQTSYQVSFTVGGPAPASPADRTALTVGEWLFLGRLAVELVGFTVCLVGFTLCLFAPAHAGVRRHALAALACLFVQGALGVLALTPVSPPPFPMEIFHARTTAESRAAWMSHISREREHAALLLRRSMCTDAFGFVVSGVTVAVLPAFLRHTFRAVGAPAERWCDRLLQVGVAAVGFSVLVFAVGAFAPEALGSPAALIRTYLGPTTWLIWWGAYGVVLVRLWWVMRRRRAGPACTRMVAPDRTAPRPPAG